MRLTINGGSLVKEVYQHFNDWISEVLHICEGVNRVEFEWPVDPIPIDDCIGKEIITKLKSSISHEEVFYTGLNGREMMKRVRKERDFFRTNDTEGVPSNYYLINGRLVLEGDGARLVLLNDRTQGGSSTEEGALELTLQQRLLYDDKREVNETLNETENGHDLISRGKVCVVLNSGSKEAVMGERIRQKA